MDAIMDAIIMKQIEKYGKASIYPTGRINKKGEEIYGIAFYYDDIKGCKQRKVITGNKEELIQKRINFLNAIYQQKLEALKITVTTPTANPSVAASFSPICTVTLKKAIEEFLIQYEPTVSHSTFLGEKTTTNNIARIMGNMLVRNITFDDFQSLINTISQGKNGNPAAPKTVRNHIISFKRIMKYCRKKKWISADDFELITSDIKIPTYITDNNHEEQVKVEKALTCAEAKEVLESLKRNKRYYLVAKILLLTGMRPQEFFALEKTDMVKKEGYIHIRQALIRQDTIMGNNRLYGIGTTKNKGSRRKVPATPVIFHYFDELEKLLQDDGSRKKSVSMGNENFIIVDKNGNIIDEHAFGINMVRYLQRNGNCKKFTLGMPRHFYQDQLDILGANINEMEKAVGHVINTVSERHYKVNEQYLKRLLPYVEELGIMLENAVKMV